MRDNPRERYRGRYPGQKNVQRFISINSAQTVILSWGREFDRVVDQVVDYLLHPVGIGKNQGQAGWQMRMILISLRSAGALGVPGGQKTGRERPLAPF